MSELRGEYTRKEDLTYSVGLYNGLRMIWIDSAKRKSLKPTCVIVIILQLFGLLKEKANTLLIGIGPVYILVLSQHISFSSSLDSSQYFI